MKFNSREVGEDYHYSIMSKFDFIDALIIFAGVIIILHPLILILSRRSLSKFKHFFKPKSKMADLPDDVIRLILSKLDIVTLHNCTKALSLDAILPDIVSLSTPLPESVFVHDMSKYWCCRVVNKIQSQILPRLSHMMPNCTHAPLYNVLHKTKLWANTPNLSKDLWWFIRKLKGLKLLEVEVPAFPCEFSKDRPNLWHKWEGKTDVHGVVDHFVHVIGDTVDDDEIESIEEQVIRAHRIAMQTWSLHSSVVLLGYKGRSWKTGLTLKTKDVGGTGCLEMNEIGPHTCIISNDNGRDRIEIFHLPSTTMFSEDGCQVQDVVLIIHLMCPKGYDDVDVVKAYLSDSYDEFKEANQTTTTTTTTSELKQIVKQILADENCKLVHSA